MTQKFFAGLFALLILSAGIASADTFTFTYSSMAPDNSISASGIITATYDSPGVYAITDVTGFRNGKAILFVATPDPSIDLTDNILLVPANPGFLTFTGTSGFAIETSDGTFNPYYSNGSVGTSGDYYEYTFNGSSPGTEITFSAQQVPDGGVTLMLLGGAFVGLTALRRKLHV